MKRFLLFTMLCIVSVLFGALPASAQTDVTSTYLTNADFSQSTPIATNLKGYGKDGTPYGFQKVDGWTSVVTNGDNSNASYPNSGMGGAVFAYGSTYQLQGGNQAAPTAGPDGNAGNCLGFFAVWGCGGYYCQDVTLPAGKYTITIPMYNQVGTQANTTYTGFFPTSGTASTVAVNPAVGQWVNQTVTFNLTAETKGQIRIGYQSTGGGSSANPHLFIDCVKIEFTALVVKDVLSTALTAAKKANASLNNSELTTAIETAQAVYDNENATQDEVNAAAERLNVAVMLAMSDAGDVTFLLNNPGFESCTETTTNAAAGGSAAPLEIGGEWTQASSAAWSSSAVVAYGGSGQVNGVSAPAADNLGNTGKTLGVSVGWGGTVTYKSAAITLPAGVYTATIYGYNALKDVTQFKSQFGFVPTSGSSTISTKNSFAYGTWESDQITITLNEATEGSFQVGGTAVSGGSGSNAKVFFDNITITYSSFLAAAKADWDAAVEEANKAKTDNQNVKGQELTALNAELAKAEPTTVDGYEEATAALNNATSAFTSAAPNYNALVAEIAYAATINVSTTEAQAVANASTTTFATALAATQDLKVLEYTTVSDTFKNVVTSLLGSWTSTFDQQSGQHWDGSDTKYSDKWSSSAATPSCTQTVTLPAGTYTLKIAGRGASGASLSMSVQVGDAEAVSADFFCTGDTGLGINKNGETNFNAEDEAGFANNNAGRGWQWRYITFTTDGASDVVLTVAGSVNNSWIGFTDPILLCDDETYSNTEFIAAKAALENAIDEAGAKKAVANVGNGVFQIPTSAVSALTTAISAAQNVYNNGTTATEMNDAKSTLESAVSTYEAAEINAPTDGQLFTVSLASGKWSANGIDFENQAMTYIANDRPDAGLYNIQYKLDANVNLAQAFTFTKVEGNKYKMSQIDADGVARYICTGVVYSGNAAQIRTTTDASKALSVEVIPTSEEGIWNLKNTEANQYIGAQDAGVYTVNSHIKFKLAETQKPSIVINTTAAGYGTVMLPFAVSEITSGVKVYSCAAVDGKLLTLEEVTEMKANTPYIIEGAWDATLTGDAQGTALTYSEGLLTGVYTQTDAPVGSYVLQKLNDKVAFYVVEEGKQPMVGANRAYLTAPAGSNVKAIFFDDTATGINGINAGGDFENAVIYNLSGQRVSNPSKGIYIVNGKKVLVK